MGRKKKLTVVVDFDGVCNNYEGWAGPEELFEPRLGIEDFLEELSQYFRVVILSTRPAEKLQGWFEDYGLDEFVDGFVDHKPPAVAYLDDRGINFDGDYDKALERIKNFKPYWKEWA